jgi:hypothetical protein
VQIVLDSLDDICVVASNKDFQEHVILLPNVLDKIDEQIVSMSSEDSLQPLKDHTLPLVDHQEKVIDYVFAYFSVGMLEPLKEEIFLFPPSQQEVIFHVFHDSLDNLFKVSQKGEFLLFTSTGFGINLHFGLPSFISLCLLKENVSRNQSRNHLLDWLHWKE